MPITFSAVEKTPDRLLYLVTIVAGVPNPATGIIPNRINLGVPLGLWADATSVFRGSPLANLLQQTLTAGDNAGARRIIFGDGRTSGISINAPRCKVNITPRVSLTPNPSWSVDANEGTAQDAQSAGQAILVIFGPNVNGATAYVDIHLKHTMER